MRIVGGSRRGLRLAGVDAPGVRPTTDRVREALFNILGHDPDLRTDAGPCPAGYRVLDVFAGTGAVGIEALSRGAVSATFIESADASLNLLRQNLKAAGMSDQSEVRSVDATRSGRARQGHDLVYLDPPYGAGLVAATLAALRGGGWIGADAVIVVETDKRERNDWPDGFVCTDTRDYGRTRLAFLRLAGSK